MRKVDFEVYKGYVAYHIPTGAYPPETLHYNNVESWKKILEERLKDHANGAIEVASIGEGVTFVKEGDKVLTANFARLELIYREIEGQEYPNCFWISREAEILLKSK